MHNLNKNKNTPDTIPGVGDRKDCCHKGLLPSPMKMWVMSHPIPLALDELENQLGKINPSWLRTWAVFQDNFKSTIKYQGQTMQNKTKNF